MVNREDVERIVENVLRGLTIDVSGGNHFSPNSRCIVLRLNGQEIARESFDIVQKPEH